MLGLSTALGAFVAGVMLADSPYRHELEADVEPFRSILLGLFFLAVGMMLDLGAIAERPLFVVGMALALIAVKTAIIFGIARVFGMDWRGGAGARAAAQPGRRIRLRPVRAGAAGAADRPRGGEPVRGGGDFVDGDDAVPDDGHPALPRGAGGIGRSARRAPRRRRQRDRRRLRPLRPDGGADARRGQRSGDADRHRHRDDRRRPAASAPKSISATARGSTCCARPEPARPS